MDISKVESAKRQLETAIKLYFKDRDPISIHTLTAAAHQILMDLSKPESIKSIMKDAALEIVVEGKKKEYLDIINKAENFFKHAEKDPHSLLQFNPEQTEYLLFDAVEMYMQLAKESPEDLSIYRVWFLLKHPTLVSSEILKKLKGHDIDYMHLSNTMNKLGFYKVIKEHFMR